MYKSRLFWKLFLAYAGLNLALAAAFVAFVSPWQTSRVVEQVERRLHDSASILRSHVEDYMRQGRSEEMQSVVVRLGQETNTRMTIVAPDGVVLADSQENPSSMENHSNRSELVQATQQGEGGAQRYSPTLDVRMKYYALRIGAADSPQGLVRVALPMTAVERQINTVRRRIWTIAAAVSLCALGVTYLVVAGIMQPISTLTEAADAIASGDYENRAVVRRRDELGVLGHAFNQMSKELSTRVAQLRQSGERMATVLGGMHEGVIAVDSRQRILIANAAAGKVLGFDADGIDGHLLRQEVRHPLIHQTVDDTLSTSRGRRLELDLSHSTKHILSVNSTPLPGTPCPGVVLVLHDITELRRLESLRQEFVANVSHELKTPLSSIKAYAETLGNGALDDPEHSRQFVQRIEDQADRLDQLIRDLLSLARIESGQQAFDVAPVALTRVVEATIGHYRASADAKRITLRSEPDESLAEVQADEEAVRQILDNLIDNAIKYTPDDGQVVVRWHREDGMGVIQVQDTGIGIAVEDQPRLFERFYRVDKARSRELGGTGLGLSIVKHLAQFFGGSVAVKSQPGEGSTFSVRLPAD